MRRLILAASLLALAACNRNEQSPETTGIDQNITAEAIGGNDLTAIDAATNDAANMAADAEAALDADANLANATDNEVTVNTATANEQ